MPQTHSYNKKFNNKPAKKVNQIKTKNKRGLPQAVQQKWP